jgi:chemotaxis protein CheX
METGGRSMDVTFVNPFIEATLNVLETMASTKAVAGDPYFKQDQVARGDVSAVIGLTGEVGGTLSVSFTETCILPIVSAMLGEEMKEMNGSINDAVGETTNMIAGLARRKLDDLGRSLRAAIPTVIAGKNHTITHITDYPVVAVPFSTDNGGFTIEVCFEK